MSLTYTVLLCLHVLASAFWVGGMSAMHFAVRPAALAALEGPARLGFMSAALGRFLNQAGAAVAVLLFTGLAMIAMSGGFGRIHWRVHAMFGIGLLMIGIYGHIRFAGFAALRRALAAREWAQAAAKLDSIRRLVTANLALGVLVFAVALVGRAL